MKNERLREIEFIVCSQRGMKKVPPKRGKVRAETQKRFPPMAKSCLRVKSAGRREAVEG